MAKELAVILNHNGVEIVADPDNLTSLTALWKAAGSDDAKTPSKFLRNAHAKEFLASLAENLKGQNCPLTKVRKGGRNSGVWAHWQVAMAYAKWLSPEFHQAVNEGFRRWYEEEKNPGLKLERSVDKLLSRGVTAAWIKTRVDGIVSRKELCGTMADHNCRPVGKLNPYAEATRSITLAAVGKTPREFKSDNGLRRTASTRDHMTSRELMRIAFIESESAAVIRDRAADGNGECLGAVRDVCDVAKATFRAIESGPKPTPARSA